MVVGKETDMADAVEAVRYGVLQEAADELVGRKRCGETLPDFP